MKHIVLALIAISTILACKPRELSSENQLSDAAAPELMHRKIAADACAYQDFQSFINTYNTAFVADQVERLEHELSVLNRDLESHTSADQGFELTANRKLAELKQASLEKVKAYPREKLLASGVNLTGYDLLKTHVSRDLAWRPDEQGQLVVGKAIGQTMAPNPYDRNMGRQANKKLTVDLSGEGAWLYLKWSWPERCEEAKKFLLEGRGVVRSEALAIDMKRFDAFLAQLGTSAGDRFRPVTLQGNSLKCTAYAIVSDMELHSGSPDLDEEDAYNSSANVDALLANTNAYRPMETQWFDLKTFASFNSKSLVSVQEAVAKLKVEDVLAPRKNSPALYISTPLMTLMNFGVKVAQANSGRWRVTDYLGMKVDPAQPHVTKYILDKVLAKNQSVMLLLSSDRKKILEDWYEPLNGSVMHIVNLAGGGKGLSPITMFDSDFYLVRDSLVPEAVHYKVESNQLLQNIVGIVKVLDVAKM